VEHFVLKFYPVFLFPHAVDARAPAKYIVNTVLIVYGMVVVGANFDAGAGVDF
jgi:hypothetical protein